MTFARAIFNFELVDLNTGNRGQRTGSRAAIPAGLAARNFLHAPSP
jgi:hypothetical protein